MNEIKGLILYQENTKSHIDDIFLRRRNKNREQGKSIFIGSLYVFIGIIVISILSIIFINNINSKIIGILVITGSSFFLYKDFKFILTLDNLQIYSNGIDLPIRTLNEKKENKSHFILFKDITVINIDKNFLIDNKILLNPIYVIKNDGKVEKINPYLIGDIKNIIKIINEKVKIKYIDYNVL